jgi:hypothetical protein
MACRADRADRAGRDRDDDRLAWLRLADVGDPDPVGPQQSTRQRAMATALVVSGSFGPSRLSAGGSGDP